MVAAGVIALMKQPRRKSAAALAIGSLSFSLLLSLIAFAHVLSGWAHGAVVREIFNFTWFRFGSTQVELGWVLDPLAAIMLVMVSFVGLLIFIYSTGYMAHDENFTRFFCFLSLFAGAMLGVVISNSILLLFMCWEIVGLTSYLLIGFWYQKPSAAAAAKKAFITTRFGDVFFFLGIVWLFSQTGTLLFYNHGVGSLEGLALANLLTQHAGLGLSAAGAIGLLIFAGAAGKSGQLPLHVWLPDAMEGPTPVSALIHAATMVAAGVYLVARVYPLMQIGAGPSGSTTALTVITWVGAATAVFAALIAIAQNDIKRILAYSTISQLGYMMAGLGLGGVAVGMFHLITHAFFKSLLVSWRGLGDSRLPRGAGRAAHGRSPRRYAVHLRHIRGRHAGALRVPDFLFRFLVQGRNPRSRALVEHLACPVLSAGLRRRSYSVLYDAAGLLRILRILARAQTGARKPASHDPADGDFGLLRHGAGRDRNSGVAVVPRISRQPCSRLRSAHLCRGRLLVDARHFVPGRGHRNWPGLAALRRQIAEARRAGRARKVGAVAVGRACAIAFTSMNFTA